MLGVKQEQCLGWGGGVLPGQLRFISRLNAAAFPQLLGMHQHGIIPTLPCPGGRLLPIFHMSFQAKLRPVIQ